MKYNTSKMHTLACTSVCHNAFCKAFGFLLLSMNMVQERDTILGNLMANLIHAQQKLKVVADVIGDMIVST